MKKTSNTAGNKLDKTGGKITGSLDVSDILTVNGKEIFDIVYPIGSIYTSVNSTNPSSLFGGIWVQIKDTFLLACGNAYSNGDTGGSASATSSKANGNTGSTKLTISQMPAHSHTFKSIPTTDTQTWQPPNQVFTYKYVKGTNYTMTTTETGGGTGHTHTLNSHSHTVDTMPPYLAVYVWKRTA